jgi:hypothetical protein
MKESKKIPSTASRSISILTDPTYFAIQTILASFIQKHVIEMVN